jgi:hypothetical protein
VAPLEEKSTVGSCAGETSRKSDSSSDVFHQLGLTMSWPPLSAEALEALEAELRLQVSSTAGGDCAVIADLPATEGGG